MRTLIRRAKYTSALEQLREDFANEDLADSVRVGVPFRDGTSYGSFPQLYAPASDLSFFNMRTK